MQFKITTTSYQEVKTPIFFKSDTGIYYGILSEDLGISISADGINSTKFADIYTSYYKLENEVTKKEFKKVLKEMTEKFNSAI